MTPDIRANEAASAGVTAADVEQMVGRAIGSTFYGVPLTAAQLGANARIPGVSGQAFADAARSPHRLLLAGFVAGRLAGFMIAARHAPRDLELDWLMIDPELQGSGLADRLMTGGLAWLGDTAPVWLTVIRHNYRAIAFYRRHGFDIDAAARLDRAVPSWIMRRPPPALADAGVATTSRAGRKCA